MQYTIFNKVLAAITPLSVTALYCIIFDDSLLVNLNVVTQSLTRMMIHHMFLLFLCFRASTACVLQHNWLVFHFCFTNCPSKTSFKYAHTHYYKRWGINKFESSDYHRQRHK